MASLDTFFLFAKNSSYSDMVQKHKRENPNRKAYIVLSMLHLLKSH